MAVDGPVTAVQPDGVPLFAAQNRRWLSRYLDQQGVEQDNFWFQPNLMLPEDLTAAWSHDTHTSPAAGSKSSLLLP